VCPRYARNGVTASALAAFATGGLALGLCDFFHLAPGKILESEMIQAYVSACPNSHVPVVATLSEGELPG
jgi:hypothetical protein